jgi:hypothetical protein
MDFSLKLNVTAQWLTLLPHIQEVPSSDLSLETSYPHRGICGFPQSPQANSRG